MSDRKDELKARVDVEHAVAAVPEEAERIFTKTLVLAVMAMAQMWHGSMLRRVV